MSIYTKKRLVPLENGSESFQVWDSEQGEWVSWINLEMGGISVDLSCLEDCSSSEPYEGDPISLSELNIHSTEPADSDA